MARRKAANALLAVAYIRVSTDDQALGPKAQLSAVQRWAQANNVTIMAVHQDLGLSGGLEADRRPGLMAALGSLSTHRAGLLLVAKRDRLARDVVVAATVERLVQRKGAKIVSADGTNAEGPEGMLMRGMNDLFAQYERALIRSRTSAALAVKQSKGERVGAAPIGYQVSSDGVHIEADASEQVAIARIRELRADGFAIAAIAATLNDEGVPARGKRWHPTTVQRLLDRAAAVLGAQ